MKRWSTRMQLKEVLNDEIAQCSDSKPARSLRYRGVRVCGGAGDNSVLAFDELRAPAQSRSARRQVYGRVSIHHRRADVSGRLRRHRRQGERVDRRRESTGDRPVVRERHHADRRGAVSDRAAHDPRGEGRHSRRPGGEQYFRRGPSLSPVEQIDHGALLPLGPHRHAAYDVGGVRPDVGRPHRRQRRRRPDRPVRDGPTSVQSRDVLELPRSERREHPQRRLERGYDR